MMSCDGKVRSCDIRVKSCDNFHADETGNKKALDSAGSHKLAMALVDLGASTFPIFSCSFWTNFTE